MANHKSAIKRIRANDVKRVRNRYYHKTTRNALRMFMKTTVKSQLEEVFSKLVSMVDKLAKKKIIHNNKAANIKSKLHGHFNLAQA